MIRPKLFAMATALTAAAITLFAASAPAQMIGRRDGPDTNIDAAASRQVVEGIISELKAAYVFPETAAKLIADLRARLDHKEYEKITSAKKLASTLTEQLQAISKDKHLRVFYSSDPIPEMRESDAAKPAPEKSRGGPDHAAAVNFGFEKAERLEGNVGLLDLRMFMAAEQCGETATAAMNLLSNTDALIIDLRKNGGGAPSMVALLCSYLFGPEPVHLNDLYFRPDDSTHQWWTFPLVPGKRFEGKPVYVLTSKRTFSAAEEFAYNLKCLKRATIVGETTGGGAHPGGIQRLHQHFGVFVPSGRAINPVTKTNWEGTGVTPHLSVPADQALATAHLAALRSIAAGLDEQQHKDAGQVDFMKRDEVKRAIERLEKETRTKDSPKLSHDAGAVPEDRRRRD